MKRCFCRSNMGLVEGMHLKYEFGMNKNIPAIEIAKKMIKQSVKIYNSKRRNYSLQLKTPNFAHINQQHDYVSYKRGIDLRVKC